MEGLDEAFIVGGVRGKWKVVFASNGFGGGTTAGGGFELSGYTSGWVVVVYSTKGLSGIGGCFAAWSFLTAAMVEC